MLLFSFSVTLAWGQRDFEQAFFTIDEASLPEVPEISAFEYKFERFTYFEKKKITDFLKVTSQNYWQPVDMAEALERKTALQQSEFDLSRLQNEFGTANKENYTSDGATRVSNPVYQERVGLDLITPYPPFGYCAGCPSYRGGRGF